MGAVPYEAALAAYHASNGTSAGPTDAPELLSGFHPDHSNAFTPLLVGANRGDKCPDDIARQLQSNALIDDVDIAGAPMVATDVLIIGGGGAGCAAALTAEAAGAKVILLNKLRLGDCNTVMAEGGIQAAVGADDSPQ